jgi:hemolysin activation/secretion protein
MIKPFALFLCAAFLSVEAVQVQAVVIFPEEKSSAALNDVLKVYEGRTITKETVQNIKETIEEYFANSGDSLLVVKVPEQKVKDGRILVTVETPKLESISIQGNRWFFNSSIQSALQVNEGDLIQENSLLDSAAWINRNPFIHTELVLSPGSVPNTTHLEVIAKDRFPARVYAGADNTGSSFSGNERFFAGTNISLGLNHLLTYQFTSGYNFPEFLSHFGNWTISLPCQDQLIFYGGYALMHPEIPDFESKGEDIQVSARYLIPFKPFYTPFQHQLLCGLDYKLTNSSLFFLGTLADGSDRQLIHQKLSAIFQGYAGYQLEAHWNEIHVTFKLETFFSPAEFLPHQNKRAYNSLREGADIRYIYSKLACGLTYQLPADFSLSTLLRGQVASASLLPSEQLGLGGYDTVRGYQERIYLADNGLIGNLEFRSPSISFCKSDSLVFLAFCDGAYGQNWNASAASPVNGWLLGIGPGARYHFSSYLTARMDYGFRVHNTPFGNGQLGRLHFAATLSY